ncbi:MAG: protocatechuate 3,4-dioxygenase, beta subunit [Polaromonas sp.]|jgi:protocatechuate 3,4-dioxygenase beta subunit|nr:protocatechuate 3,4-dioxygenase, beta subunit [Polaromonas sp.]
MSASPLAASNPDNTCLSPRDWSAHPPHIYPFYKSTALRGPTQPLVPIRQALSELTAPVYGHDELGPHDHDLTKNAVVNGQPLGERIIVTGRVEDEDGRPVRHTLVEVWQANAAGRYVHKVDQHSAPLDPNFLGAGRCMTDDDGNYRFMTIKPGAYPWGNHTNAWRPQHIHFSLFGEYFPSRLVTQMYFPGDPLFAFDPMYQGVPEHLRELMVARFSLDVTQADFALGYVFDIVLRGPRATRFEA